MAKGSKNKCKSLLLHVHSQEGAPAWFGKRQAERLIRDSTSFLCTFLHTY